MAKSFKQQSVKRIEKHQMSACWLGKLLTAEELQKIGTL